MINKDMLDRICADIDWNVGYIIEEHGGARIAENESKVFSSASIIKLNILWSLYLEINSGRLNPKEKLKIDSSDITGGSGAIRYLEPGHMLSIRELCVMMIDFSDNTATNMLIDFLGMDRINKDIADCGLGGTVLRRKMMDTNARERGEDNFTTAEDTVNILKMIENSDKINSALRQDMLDILLNQNCNRYLTQFWPEEISFAHKSGGLPDIFHDAGILYVPDGRKFNISVMTGGFPDRKSGLRFINDFGLRILEGIYS